MLQRKPQERAGSLGSGAAVKGGPAEKANLSKAPEKVRQWACGCLVEEEQKRTRNGGWSPAGLREDWPAAREPGQGEQGRDEDRQEAGGSHPFPECSFLGRLRSWWCAGEGLDLAPQRSQRRVLMGSTG